MRKNERKHKVRQKNCLRMRKDRERDRDTARKSELADYNG